MADEIHKEPPTKDNVVHQHERRLAWGWWLFAAMALFYLWSEHQAHLFGVLPYLLLLACPLLHFFMHGRHGGHRHMGSAKEDKK